MKKASKLLGLLLCCVMLLGLLPATAFAATSIDCPIPIEKIVEVSGETNPSGATFTFALTVRETGDDVSECGVTVQQQPDFVINEAGTYPGNLVVTVDPGQVHENLDRPGWIDQGDGTFALDCVLKEENGKKAYWDYSFKEYTVTLTFDRTNEELTAVIKDGNDVLGAASFTNTYKYEENPSFEIPIEKTVKEGGNKAPGATAFTFELVDEDHPERTLADYGITLTNSKVATQGVGTFTGSLKGEICDNMVNAQSVWKQYNENSPVYYVYFTLTEKDDGAARWTYSEAKYTVYISYNTVTKKVSTEVCDYRNDTVRAAASFTNTYTRNVSTTTHTVESAKTADAGIALYAGLAILSMTGSAGVVLRRRKNDK